MLTAAPAPTSTHVGTQYIKYIKSLLHEESLAILLKTDFCHGWLESAVSPEETAVEAGEMEVPSTWWAPGLCMSLDMDKLPAPPGRSPSSTTAATPPAGPSRWVIAHQQTRDCLQPLPNEPQHYFMSLSSKPTKQRFITSCHQNEDICCKHLRAEKRIFLLRLTH